MSVRDELSVLHLTTSEEVFFDQQIESLRERGINCTVLVVPGQEQIDGNMGNQRGPSEYIRFLFQVRSELKQGDYDIVHANYGLTAPHAVMLSDIPVVLTLWGSDVVGLDGAITKLFAWRCDAVTVRSEEMKELLGHSDAYILPSGIDMDKFYPIDRDEAREEAGWDQEGYHVLFPYSPEYERKRFPLAESIVEAASERLGQEITLHSLSGVPHEKMVYYMNAADALLLTSRHEGSPNTVKEALACNIPVVSTNVGDVEERLADVFPSAVGSNEEELVEGLVEVIRDGRRSNGRETVREISWENIGARIMKIYKDVLSQHGISIAERPSPKES